MQQFQLNTVLFENAWKHILGRETKILGTQNRVWVVAASFNQTCALDVGPGGGTLQVDWKEEIKIVVEVISD